MLEAVAVYVVCAHFITSLNKPLNCKLDIRTFVRFPILQCSARLVKCLLFFILEAVFPFSRPLVVLVARIFSHLVARLWKNHFPSKSRYLCCRGQLSKAFRRVRDFGDINIALFVRIVNNSVQFFRSTYNIFYC